MILPGKVYAERVRRAELASHAHSARGILERYVGGRGLEALR
jgi:hypothetical protein